MPGYYSRPARLGRQARQLLLPRRCPYCREVLGTLLHCEACAPRLEELRRSPTMRLARASHYLGRLEGAAAPYRYEGVVRDAILRAKYEGESWTAVELGVEMTARLFGAKVEMHFAEPVPGPVAGAAVGYDCIIPVPASSRRRGYNVPERMARSAVSCTGASAAAEGALPRPGWTPSGRAFAGGTSGECGRRVSCAGAGACGRKAGAAGG